MLYHCYYSKQQAETVGKVYLRASNGKIYECTGIFDSPQISQFLDTVKVYVGEGIVQSAAQVAGEPIISAIDLSELPVKRKKSRDYSNECAICFETLEQRYALAPCGHASYCHLCARRIKSCPICNKSIRQRLRIFL